MSKTLHCGLLGRTLGHSYSPQIHAALSDYLTANGISGYTYGLIEVEPEQVEETLRSGTYDGFNVTIPYKKTVLPFCDILSDAAREIGSVNTIVRRADGKLYGDNTDAAGLIDLMAHAEISAEGKKVLVLGTGGASAMATVVLKQMGAEEIVIISRHGENNYLNLDRHSDAEILINCTPAGMYPENGTCLVNLEMFPHMTGVVDIVYNPARTALLLQAEKLGIPCADGLYMLVSQAKRSSELFNSVKIADEQIAQIEHTLKKQMRNIVLIGMPGCGKTTISELLGEALGREVVDTDRMITENAGRSIPEIFAESGEAEFRRMETEAAAEAGKLSGKVIATGGGIVTRAENYPLLHQNSVIVWIRRDFTKLPKDGRPISQKTDPARLYAVRKPLYEAFADITAENDGTVEETVREILRSII